MRKVNTPMIVMTLMVLGTIGLIFGIVATAVSGSNAQAREQQARVAVCAHVHPAAARGACVEGKPTTVTRTIVRTIVRRIPAPSVKVPETMYGLLQQCLNLASKDAKNEAYNAAQTTNNVPPIASDLGTCLSGVGSMANNLPLGTPSG